MPGKWAALCVVCVAAAAFGAAPPQAATAPATDPATPTLNADHQTLVTLHTKDASPRDVFDLLAKQAGVTFQTSPPDLWDNVDGAANIDYDKQPFWQVLHELALSYDVAPSTNSSPRHITLTHNANSPWLKQPAFIAGPLILDVGSISYNRQINYAQDQIQNSLSLQLYGFMDPNARLITYAPSLEVTAATDDHDNSLCPPAAATPSRFPNFNGRNRLLSVNINVPLQYPAANPGTRVVKIKGNLRAIILSKTDTLTFDDLKAGDATKTAGNFTVVLHGIDVQDQNHTVAVHLTISSAKPNPDGGTPAHVGPVARRNSNDPLSDPLLLANQMELIDTTGRAYINRGVNDISGGGTGQTTMTINFGPDYSLTPRAANAANPAPIPAKLLIEVPLESKEISIPVELSDIPIP